MAKHAVNGIDIHYQIDGDISGKTIMFSVSSLLSRCPAAGKASGGSWDEREA